MNTHPLAEWLFVTMQNACHWHERVLPRYLERRQWVVFYLEDYARHCPEQGTCWLDHDGFVKSGDHVSFLRL